MTKQKIAYFVTTGLLAAFFTFSGFNGLTQSAEMKGAMAHLGYPVYLLGILGVWKLLGVAALLAPGLPRLKEWAYAGFTFNLTGAAISHAVVGDPTSYVVIPLVLLGLAAASWALRPEDRRLGSRPAAGARSVPGASPTEHAVAA